MRKSHKIEAHKYIAVCGLQRTRSAVSSRAEGVNKKAAITPPATTDVTAPPTHQSMYALRRTDVNTSINQHQRVCTLVPTPQFASFTAYTLLRTGTTQYCTTILQYYNIIILPHYYTTKVQYNDTVILHYCYNSTIIHQYYSTTIPQSTNTLISTFVVDLGFSHTFFCFAQKPIFPYCNEQIQ